MRRITARIANQGPFTAQEAEVLRLMCEGLYGPEIADRLYRSPRTIDKHRENIAQKLNARGTSEIIVIARELGYIEITLTNSNHHLLKTLLLLIICNALFPQDDMRHEMRRPHRARTHAVRTIRLHRQQ